MAKEVILRTNIQRDKNYLYYCGTDEYGNITIGRALMARGGKSKVTK